MLKTINIAEIRWTAICRVYHKAEDTREHTKTKEDYETEKKKEAIDLENLQNKSKVVRTHGGRQNPDVIGERR